MSTTTGKDRNHECGRYSMPCFGILALALIAFPSDADDSADVPGFHESITEAAGCLGARDAFY
jgi:hypothetical protein